MEHDSTNKINHMEMYPKTFEVTSDNECSEILMPIKQPVENKIVNGMEYRDVPYIDEDVDEDVDAVDWSLPEKVLGVG